MHLTAGSGTCKELKIQHLTSQDTFIYTADNKWMVGMVEETLLMYERWYSCTQTCQISLRVSWWVPISSQSSWTGCLWRKDLLLKLLSWNYKIFPWSCNVFKECLFHQRTFSPSQRTNKTCIPDIRIKALMQWYSVYELGTQIKHCSRWCTLVHINMPRLKDPLSHEYYIIAVAA